MLTAELVDALVAIHAAGLTHGHLTPAAVLLTVDGGAQLIGLGRAGTEESGGGTSADDLVALGEVVRTTLGPTDVSDEWVVVLGRFAAAGSSSGFADAASARDALVALVPGAARLGVAGDGPRRSVVRSLPLAARILLGLFGAGAVIGLGAFAAGRLGFRFSDPPATVVPEVEGEAQGVAEARVQASGLSTRYQDQTSAAVPEGHVIAQDPAGGADARGRRGHGGDQHRWPPRQHADARGSPTRRCRNGADRPGPGRRGPAEGRTNLPTGEVYDQLPAAGDEASEGQRVLLFVAGPR